MSISQWTETEKGERAGDKTPQKPGPSDLFPLGRPHLLRLPNLPQTVPPAGSRELQTIARGGTFHAETQTNGQTDTS